MPYFFLIFRPAMLMAFLISYHENLIGALGFLCVAKFVGAPLSRDAQGWLVYFLMEKVILFSLFIVLVEMGTLHCVVVVWLMAAEFIESGTRLIKVAMNAKERIDYGSRVRYLCYFVLGAIALLVPLWKSTASSPRLIDQLPVLISGILVVMASVSIIQRIMDPSVKKLFVSREREDG